MTYLDDIAQQIRKALPREIDVPKDADHLFVLYAILVRVRGMATTGRDVHDAWSAWMGMREPSHESLVPFEELAPDVQQEDAPFVDAIRAVASRLARNHQNHA